MDRPVRQEHYMLRGAQYIFGTSYKLNFHYWYAAKKVYRNIGTLSLTVHIKLIFHSFIISQLLS